MHVRIVRVKNGQETMFLLKMPLLINSRGGSSRGGLSWSTIEEEGQFGFAAPFTAEPGVHPWT